MLSVLPQPGCLHECARHSDRYPVCVLARETYAVSSDLAWEYAGPLEEACGHVVPCRELERTAEECLVLADRSARPVVPAM